MTDDEIDLALADIEATADLLLRFKALRKEFGVKTCRCSLSVLLLVLALCGCKSSFLAPRTGEVFQTTRMGPGNSACAYMLPLTVGGGCLMSEGLAVLGIPLVAVGIPVAGVGVVADVCVASPIVDLVCLPYMRTSAAAAFSGRRISRRIRTGDMSFGSHWPIRPIRTDLL